MSTTIPSQHLYDISLLPSTSWTLYNESLLKVPFTSIIVFTIILVFAFVSTICAATNHCRLPSRPPSLVSSHIKGHLYVPPSPHPALLCHSPSSPMMPSMIPSGSNTSVLPPHPLSHISTSTAPFYTKLSRLIPYVSQYPSDTTQLRSTHSVLPNITSDAFTSINYPPRPLSHISTSTGPIHTKPLRPLPYASRYPFDAKQTQSTPSIRTNIANDVFTSRNHPLPPLPHISTSTQPFNTKLSRSLPDTPLHPYNARRKRSTPPIRTNDPDDVFTFKTHPLPPRPDFTTSTPSFNTGTVRSRTVRPSLRFPPLRPQELPPNDPNAKYSLFSPSQHISSPPLSSTIKDTVSSPCVSSRTSNESIPPLSMYLTPPNDINASCISLPPPQHMSAPGPPFTSFSPAISLQPSLGTSNRSFPSSSEHPIHFHSTANTNPPLSCSQHTLNPTHPSTSSQPSHSLESSSLTSDTSARSISNPPIHPRDTNLPHVPSSTPPTMSSSPPTTFASTTQPSDTPDDTLPFPTSPDPLDSMDPIEARRIVTGIIQMAFDTTFGQGTYDATRFITLID